MGAIERIIDAILSVWRTLIPFVVIDTGHGAGIFRLGIYHRTLGPGFHWKWPVIEEELLQNTSITTIRLDPQTLITKDGITLVVSAIVKYQIENLEPFLTEIWDQNDVLSDVSMGAIRLHVNQQTYSDLMANPPEDKVATMVRREVNRFGFKIHKVTFTDIGKIHSIRLLTHNPLHLE